jgi:hypothetical protein
MAISAITASLQAAKAMPARFRRRSTKSQIGKGGHQLLSVFLDGDILEKQGKKIEAYRQDLFEREYSTSTRSPMKRPEQMVPACRHFRP